MKRPIERLKNSITKDNLWFYILKILSKESSYPYKLREEIEKRFGFRPGNVTTYLVLKKLAFQGFVEKWKEKSSVGPERIYYKITPKGKKELKMGIKILKEIGKKMKM